MISERTQVGIVRAGPAGLLLSIRSVFFSYSEAPSEIMR